MSTDKALPAERLNLPMRQVQCQISRPKSMSKSAQKSRRNRSKVWSFLVSRLSSSARGGLEPHFRALFSAIFQVFPWGISIRVETCGSERKQKCGKLWSIYVQSFYVF